MLGYRHTVIMDRHVMSATRLKHHHGEAPVALVRDSSKQGLSALVALASVDIETSLVANLSDDLHHLFDPVSDDVLPIYFGPLLGRLYLEGL